MGCNHSNQINSQPTFQSKRQRIIYHTTPGEPQDDYISPLLETNSAAANQKPTSQKYDSFDGSTAPDKEMRDGEEQSDNDVFYSAEEEDRHDALQIFSDHEEEMKEEEEYKEGRDPQDM